MKVMPSLYTITELAKVTETPIETVRFYQRRGLLPKRKDVALGRRCYLDEDVQRLTFIKSAKQLHFSLDEIGQILKLPVVKSPGKCNVVADSIKNKKQLLELERMGIERAIQNLNRLEVHCLECRAQACGFERSLTCGNNKATG